MPSFIYNSAIDDNVRGNIIYGTDTFKVMLVDASYVENKDTHTRRSHVTGEISGPGYTAGGMVVAPTVTKDLVNDRVDVVFPEVALPNSTISARKAVYYKSRGGAATADELVAVNDFGVKDISTVNGTFTLAASTVRGANT